MNTLNIERVTGNEAKLTECAQSAHKTLPFHTYNQRPGNKTQPPPNMEANWTLLSPLPDECDLATDRVPETATIFNQNERNIAMSVRIRNIANHPVFLHYTSGNWRHLKIRESTAYLKDDLISNQIQEMAFRDLIALESVEEQEPALCV